MDVRYGIVCCACAQSGTILCNWQPTRSFVHGIVQARMLEWIAVCFSRLSSQPRDQIHISCVSCIINCTTWEAHSMVSIVNNTVLRSWKLLRVSLIKRKQNCNYRPIKVYYYYLFCIHKYFHNINNIYIKTVKNLPAMLETEGLTQVDPWVRKIPWRRACQPTPEFLPGEYQGQLNLAGYSSLCQKESNISEEKNYSPKELIILAVQSCFITV